MHQVDFASETSEKRTPPPVLQTLSRHVCMHCKEIGPFDSSAAMVCDRRSAFTSHEWQVNNKPFSGRLTADAKNNIVRL